VGAEGTPRPNIAGELGLLLGGLNSSPYRNLAGRGGEDHQKKGGMSLAENARQKEGVKKGPCLGTSKKKA